MTAPQHQQAAVAVDSWFRVHGRELPWRSASTSPWGVLVSEVMSQQTPVARVAGPWVEWMGRWPTPADLATASPADVLRVWGRLGYPRRALRLQEAAAVVVERHEGRVPADEQSLLALPGVGRYTAAAVMAFAFGRRSLVLDTNVRRVLARYADGVEHAARAETAAERRRAWDWVPDDDAAAARWSVGTMELGALVCTARNPLCDECPLASSCAWLAAGRPAWEGPARTGQSWQGTDRQCRGRIMTALRAATHPVALDAVEWPVPDQRRRCATSLVADGLAVETAAGLALPN